MHSTLTTTLALDALVVPDSEEVLQSPLSALLEANVDLGIRHHVRLQCHGERTREVNANGLIILCELEKITNRAHSFITISFL